MVCWLRKVLYTNDIRRQAAASQAEESSDSRSAGSGSAESNRTGGALAFLCIAAIGAVGAAVSACGWALHRCVQRSNLGASSPATDAAGGQQTDVEPHTVTDQRAAGPPASTVSAATARQQGISAASSSSDSSKHTGLSRFDTCGTSVAPSSCLHDANTSSHSGGSSSSSTAYSTTCASSAARCIPGSKQPQLHTGPGSTAAEDLPLNVIRQVLQLLYPDGIAGTSSALAVCSAWRDAAPDCQPLDLLINLDDMRDPEQLEQVCRWLEVHAYALQQLQLRTTDHWYPEEGREAQLLLGALLKGLAAASPAAALQHAPPAEQLVRLCVDGANSLVQLAPLLPQLQNLQYLEAGAYVQDAQTLGWNSLAVCTADQEPLQQLPDISTARALTSLRLTIYSCGGRSVTEQLCQLLPNTLQQLDLATNHYYHRVRVCNLTHLTNLRALKLQHVTVDDCGALLSVSPLQRVALSEGFPWEPDHDNLWDAAFNAGVASLLTEAQYLDPTLLRSHASALTRLESLLIEADIPDFSAVVLQQLSRLTHLHLLYEGYTHVPAVIHCLSRCADKPQLRSLGIAFIDEGIDPVATAAALAALTQLTALHLQVFPSEGLPSCWADALAALTGLQQLHLAQLWYQQLSLSPLTSLQQLVIQYMEPTSRLLQVLGGAIHTLELLVVIVSDRDLPRKRQDVMSALLAAAPRLQVLVTGELEIWHAVPAPWFWQLARRTPHLPELWQLEQ